MNPSHKIVQAGPGLHIGDYMLAQTIDRGRVISKDPKIIEGYRLETVRIAGRDTVVGSGLDACACHSGLDVSWLPFAAEHYQISADIKNYVLCEIFIVCASIPNRNLDSMSYNELTSFRSLHGIACYKSFQGKPTHQDHANSDDTKAKGVIFDSTLVPFRGAQHGTVWAVKILAGYDRTKDARLARLVQQRNRIGHSMGCLVEKTECSLPWCRYESSNGVTTCDHIQGGAGKGQIIRNFLVYENLKDYAYVENSSVEDAANVVALTDYIWGVNQ